MVSLLSSNDWDALSRAMRRMEEITLVRTLGREKVTARTLRAPLPWRVGMIVQIRRESPHIDTVQNFESVEEAARYG